MSITILIVPSLKVTYYIFYYTHYYILENAKEWEEVGTIIFIENKSNLQIPVYIIPYIL